MEMYNFENDLYFLELNVHHIKLLVFSKCTNVCVTCTLKQKLWKIYAYYFDMLQAIILFNIFKFSNSVKNTSSSIPMFAMKSQYFAIEGG